MASWEYQTKSQQDKWAAKYYVCKGHYHNLSNHLMVNPFTSEVMPDQWCQGNKPAEFKWTNKLEPTPEKRETMPQYALWCKLGNHAFDPDDDGAEEFSRTVKVKDRYGDMITETKMFSVCSEHLNTPFRGTGETKGINGSVEDKA